MTATGFHEGELRVQRRAGVEAGAKRLEKMLDSPHLSGGAARFLASQRFTALTGRDRNGVLWISALAARAGFLQGEDDLLRVSTVPREGDPLHRMPIGQHIGLIAIDFAARRRMRINGSLIGGDDAGLTVQIDQAYGNCPQYVHRRELNISMLGATPATDARHSTRLDATDQAMIAASDTFFFGTSHLIRGSDASHRGGPAGFVRVSSSTRLWWPDYPGNNMFNSFGNLAVDDEAALLFIDFLTGATLHISGTAQVQWTHPGVAGDDGGVGRRVAFSIDSVVALGFSEHAGPER